jgi:hypothetical protein
MHFCKPCCYFSYVDSTTHNWTIHVCDNVSFFKGGLHASCNKVSFKGRLLATMFISKVKYMHLCKNVFSGGHLYIPRFLFKGGLCASLATMLIFKGRLYASSLKQCSFKRSIFHPKAIFNITVLIKKDIAYVITICPSKHTTCLKCIATCTIYIKLPIVRFCKF